MKHVTAFDLETHLITRGCLVPKMVCISIATRVDRAEVLHRNDSRTYETVRGIFTAALAGSTFLGGQNIAFDMAVLGNTYPDLLPMIFELYEQDRILDSMIRQKLLDIANGVYRGYHDYSTGTHVAYYYHLKDLAQRYGYPADLDKDTWRLRYHEFDNTAVADWPEGAQEYPKHDAKSTLWVINGQEEVSIENGEDLLDDQFRQCRASFALHLISAWGLRTDRFMVARHKRRTEERLTSHRQLLQDAGLVTFDKAGAHYAVKKAKEYVKAHFEVYPETPKGEPQLDADAELMYNDPLLTAFIESRNAESVLNAVADLEQGIDVPIQTRFDELMETGRTSSSKPNVQNRSAKHVGDRECFVPRQGFVFCDNDYDGLELRTWAQVCKLALGHSRLAEVLNSGEDPHCILGAMMGGISYEELIRRKADKTDQDAQFFRQAAKIGNFGLPAGLGERSLVIQARKKYKVTIPLETAKIIRHSWLQTWPEADPYFKWIKMQCGSSDHATITHFGSNRRRGHVPFTVAANSFFQGLGADATKSALWQLVKACTVGDLAGCHVVNYVHDQFITEVPEEFGHECAEVICEISENAANEWLPDVPTKAKPMLCRRWSKLAKPVHENGRLVPWEWDEAIKEGSPGYAT